jgi:hypothetical protein
MPFLSKPQYPGEISDRLRNAHVVTAELIAEAVSAARRRGQPIRWSGKLARIERLIGSGAWTDAALALIDLELPQWQVRRIAYDDGEWYCALSRQRELPEWLDQSIEARHSDLPLAILGAFVEALRLTTPRSPTSVPVVPRDGNPLCVPVCCDNFI